MDLQSLNAGGNLHIVKFKPWETVNINFKISDGTNVEWGNASHSVHTMYVKFKYR